jgi:hypothetical protein
MTNKRTLTRSLPAALVFLVGLAAHAGAQCVDPATFQPDPEFTSNFMLDRCTFKTTGANPFFILRPGYQLVLENDPEPGEEFVRAQITVLRETQVVDGVKTRVVEESEWVDGVLVEVSRNFFAICKQTNSVVYFGEDVDIFEYDEDGNVISVSHEGAWRAGENGARPGFIMPGTILLGGKYYQEIAAADSALDKAEIVAMDDECEAGGEVYGDCVSTEDTTDCDPGAEADEKVYAAGIGVVVDGDLELVDFGFVRGHGDDEDDD